METHVKQQVKTKADFIIDEMGGTSVVAGLFGISPASVSEWRKTGIPSARLFSIKLMRPDLFEAEAANA